VRRIIERHRFAARVRIAVGIWGGFFFEICFLIFSFFLKDSFSSRVLFVKIFFFENFQMRGLFFFKMLRVFTGIEYLYSHDPAPMDLNALADPQTP
jgi:hypothetical protein